MKRTIGIALLLLATVLVPHPAGAQRRYAVGAVAIDAAVQPDGSMRIRETLTYNFRGRYTFAFRDFPPIAGGRIDAIAVSEGGRSYQESASKEPGTFEVARESSSTRVTWYYRAGDEERTFDLSYTIDGAVHRYTDTAELYYKFVGDKWDRPIGKVRAIVRFPSPLTRSDLKAWAHGPLDGTVQINGDGTVAFDVSPLPPRQFWEGRILFPPPVVANLPASSAGPRADAVLAEEGRWAEEANARRLANAQRVREEQAQRTRRSELAQLFLPLSAILSVIGLIAWFLAYRRHGLPHVVQPHVVSGEVPSTHPPALVSYLMSRHVSASAIVATLLDVADRGYLEIRETTTSKRGLFGEREVTDYQFSRTTRPLESVEPFERDLLEFLLTRGESSTTFTMSALKSNRSRRALHKWFAAWAEKVKTQARTLGFFEPSAADALLFNFLIGVAIAVVGLALSITSRPSAGLPAIVSGVLVAILTVTLRRRTAEGQRLYLAWTAFGFHLRNISSALGPVRVDSRDWARYLAAAVLFGLHKRLLPRLQPIDERGLDALPMWYSGGSGHAFAGDASSFSASVSSMVSSVSSAMSSAAGAGGGASGGGGGGAGGGGGGAG
jgi:uncharacterized membrane protein